MSYYERIIQEMIDASPSRLREAKLTEQDLRDLIDLALVLGDEEWFMELTERLNTLTV
ncbi:IDEAL domain-containing protein [Niallia circulans]|uniref:IDEAL domain-containing protein n=1 Tax=Niallia circulans TaxID=1397 RepID=UPI002E20E8BE|nr:IDEAL domain-containing protein [Niallia circulans]